MGRKFFVGGNFKMFVIQRAYLLLCLASQFNHDTADKFCCPGMGRSSPSKT